MSAIWRLLFIEHDHVLIAGNWGGRSWIKVAGYQMRHPGKLDVPTGCSDLVNLRLANRSGIAGGEVAILDEDRDMRESVDLSRG